jgi:hypothetical protein
VSRLRVRVKANMALAMCLLLAPPVNLKRHKDLPPLPPSSYKPVTEFDPKRDPEQDLKDAIVEAKHTKRRILLEVGGDWSLWSHIMDNAFESHADLRDFRAHNYVTVKVYYGRENSNEKFLRQFPRIPDYPHFFVLDSSGKFFHSQSTHKFENGRVHNVRKIDAFLKKWAPDSPSGMTPDPPPPTNPHKHTR